MESSGVDCYHARIAFGGAGEGLRKKMEMKNDNEKKEGRDDEDEEDEREGAEDDGQEFV